MIERESFWQNGMQPAIEPQLFVKASPPQSDECLHANASVFLVGQTTQRSKLLCFALGTQVYTKARPGRALPVGHWAQGRIQLH